MKIKSLIEFAFGLDESTLKVGLKNEQNRIDWLEKSLGNIPSGHRILDAGAGEQQFKKFCGHLDYVSQDFAQYVPNEISSGLHMKKWDYGKLDIVSDIGNIPVPDESFDAVMCTEVFEHIINPREAIKEFSRVLKKGGILIVTAPFCSLTHFAPYHFYTGFNRFFYENELTNNGFQIIEMSPNGNYFEYVAQEVHRTIEIGGKYSKIYPSAFERFIIKLFLKTLNKLSKKDFNSFEILNFGFHVLATKK